MTNEASVCPTLTCKKVEHLGAGYLHGHDDDGPYNVDGVLYCGRCHRAIPDHNYAAAPRDPQKLVDALREILNRSRVVDRLLVIETMYDIYELAKAALKDWEESQ